MKRLYPLVLLIAGTLSIGAYDFLPAELDLDTSITPPGAYLGFQPGERHVLHHQLIGYMQHLASQSDRMNWVFYGETHGHRKLGQLIISSPENLNRIEEIRLRHLELAEPKRSSQIDLTDMPVVVNLNYSVHGNEASGANASLVVAYYLAAALGREIDDLLENMVILLDPALNPDGLDRFANWTNAYAGKNPNPDPNSREHREGWPNGRTNYYWFDLNRDWMLLTQPESRGRMHQFHRWLPNFVLDFHEMGTDATYFFQPGVSKRSHPLIPGYVQELTRRVSMYFARALDEKNSLYFTQERFDDFYMGKGSTIADLKGAVGILFEQASSRGVVQDSVNGPVSFEFAIGNQVSVSLAVLKGAYEMRTDFLNHTRKFFSDSVNEAKKQSFTGYSFSSADDPTRAMCLVDIFRQHAIEVFKVAGEETWYVPLQQPHYRYLEALVEQRMEFEEPIFYDITAWTLPLAYNLEWRRTNAAPALETPAERNPVLDTSGMGYVFEWKNLNSPRVLFDLFQAGARVKIAKSPFRLSGKDFGYGAVFIPLRQQSEKSERIHSVLQDAMKQLHLKVVPVTSFLTENGIDLGSNSFATIDQPKILLAAGRGVDTYTTGSIWHLLDVYHDYPVTLVEPGQLKGIDLGDYTALILPGADSGTYPDYMVPLLKDWIKDGGVVVCLGSTTKWAIEKELSSGSLVKTEKMEPPARRPFSGASDDKALQDIEGAIFQTEIDVTHPIAYGYARDHLPVFLDRKDFVEPSESPYNTPVIFDDNPLLSGYASRENLELLAGSAAVMVEPIGKGSIIHFAHHPTFRASWRGTEKLLLNAILFGRLMDATD